MLFTKNGYNSNCIRFMKPLVLMKILSLFHGVMYFSSLILFLLKGKKIMIKLSINLLLGHTNKQPLSHVAPLIIYPPLCNTNDNVVKLPQHLFLKNIYVPTLSKTLIPCNIAQLHYCHSYMMTNKCTLHNKLHIYVHTLTLYCN